MCGIAGFLSRDPALNPEAALRAMADVIAHRGPDDFGFFHDAPVHLGHRRLSIVDLAAGHQPMCNENGSIWVVYNGEIFNHASLRPALEQAGHRYRTHADTEVILHGYEQYGVESAARFNGMFAWALWDRNRRRLYCARDRHGIKPFYYYWDGETFAFASEIKALLEHPAVAARINEPALAEYFAFGFNSSEETLFAGIRKLRPAHWLTLEDRGGRFELTTGRYWESPLLDTPPAVDPRDAIRECRERLEECVRSRLMADVPLGMFLSGGIDSSAIAALMRRQFDGPIQTFSVGYQEAEYGELSWARQVADRIGAEHHEVVIGFEDFFGALPSMVWHEDEPICFPSSISLYFVARLASDRVKVVLTGEGSDELFGGYERYRYHLINERALSYYQFVPGPLQSLARALTTASLLPLSLRRKLQHTFLYRQPNVESLFLDNFYCGFAPEQLAAIGASRVITGGAPYASFIEGWNVEPQQSTLARMLYADHQSYLIELLMKQDQMSMAASIESRVPFLDHTFVEFAMRLPDSLKLPANGKYILKKAVEDILPPDIIYRPKMGFPTPLRRWLWEPRSEFLGDYLCERDGLLASYFDPAKLRALVDRHRRREEDATDRLWRLVNLQVWGDLFLLRRQRRWMDGELAAGPMVRAA